MKKLILIGAGGYAKSVLDSLDIYNYEFVGFIDDYKAGTHLGYQILGDNISSIENPEEFYYFVSIGDNEKRQYWYDLLKKNNLRVINVIDTSAMISKKATIGEGNFIGKMAIINSDAHIGNNCVINTKALLEHGCHIKNNVNVSTNTVLNGDVRIENGVFFGSCSVINGQLTVGEHAIIGSGSVVVKNVEPNTIVVGVPAKILLGGKNKNAKNIHNCGNRM
jgi:sugar O-acyltransferase (sialic acid O-acetyltransferase NeuD family)